MLMWSELATAISAEEWSGKKDLVGSMTQAVNMILMLKKLLLTLKNLVLSQWKLGLGLQVRLEADHYKLFKEHISIAQSKTQN